MRRRSVIFLGVLVLAGCATVPYTNRRQFNIYSTDQEDQLGLTAFNEVKSQNKISTDPVANAMLQRVGKRIAAAANQPNYKWEFVLIDDPKTVNAFCLPGGRVAFYTGILPITKDENGIAVVMSHEVSHALAHHGAERMSEQTVVQGLQQAAAGAGWIKSPQALQLANVAYGIGVGLPHSRAQEAEADHIGLILMAKAGYDPREAVEFWQRMQAASAGKAPPEFLSDHPSDASRIESVKSQIPEALTYYHPQ